MHDAVVVDKTCGTCFSTFRGVHANVASCIYANANVCRCMQVCAYTHKLPVIIRYLHGNCYLLPPPLSHQLSRNHSFIAV